MENDEVMNILFICGENLADIPEAQRVHVYITITLYKTAVAGISLFWMLCAKKWDFYL